MVSAFINGITFPETRNSICVNGNKPNYNCQTHILFFTLHAKAHRIPCSLTYEYILFSSFSNFLDGKVDGSKEHNCTR